MALADSAVFTAKKLAQAAVGLIVRTSARSVLASDPVIIADSGAPNQATDDDPEGSVALSTVGALWHRSGSSWSPVAGGMGAAVFFDDFLADVGVAASAPWVEDAHNTATVDHVSGQGAGVLRILTESTSEAQAGQITWGDSLLINMSNNPVFGARVKVTPEAATFTADERVVIGLASAHATAEAALDDVATNCWFRLEADNLNVLTESDDGTTDDDDNDSGSDYVKGQWHEYVIDARDLAAVNFYFDGALVSTLDMTDLGANTYVQPIICHQRDAGTDANSIDVDCVFVAVER